MATKTVLVVNDGSSPIGFKTAGIDFTLNPGVNKVDADQLERAREHKTFEAHFTEQVRLHHPETGSYVATGPRLRLAEAKEAKEEAKAQGAADDAAAAAAKAEADAKAAAAKAKADAAKAEAEAAAKEARGAAKK
jgi:colicin import membrane protein